MLSKNLMMSASLDGGSGDRLHLFCVKFSVAMSPECTVPAAWRQCQCPATLKTNKSVPVHRCNDWPSIATTCQPTWEPKYMICRPEAADKAVWDEVRGWSHGGAPLWWLNGAGGLVPALVPWPAGLLGGRLRCGASPPCWVRRGALLAGGWLRGLRLEVRWLSCSMMPSAFLKWSEALGAPVSDAQRRL
jgi:hypothetical protein